MQGFSCTDKVNMYYIINPDNRNICPTGLANVVYVVWARHDPAVTTHLTCNPYKVDLLLKRDSIVSTIRQGLWPLENCRCEPHLGQTYFTWVVHVVIKT